MTYYEEFGVSPSATPDEIRHAHRRLIKILHPDLQNDENTRLLAEIQTRRINEISHILLDPMLRKEYENTLDPATVPPPAAPIRDYRWQFALAGALGVGLLWLLTTDRTPWAQPPPPASPIAASPQPAAGIAKLPSRNPHLPTDRNLDRQPSSSQPAQNPETSHPAESPSPALTPPSPSEVKPNLEPAESQMAPPKPIPTSKPSESPPPSPPPENPFIGTWVYVPEPVSDADIKLYRPEYIEMRIREIKGQLEGQYRARYHVPDRAVSPNIGFHFTGPPVTAALALHWNGSNGVGGNLELKLLNHNSVQADWNVTEMAATAGLVSGTAILTRVQ